MRKLLMCATFAVLAISSSVIAEDSSLTCLVIGQEVNPAKGRELFKNALEAWYRGQTTEAINLYEMAVIADRSILMHDDHGLAMKLLEKYRSPESEKNITNLCRRGFFENILVGNLESSIKNYEEAAKVAISELDKQLANDEAKRLRQQLSYISEWQNSIERTNRIQRARDLAEYLQASKISELQNQAEESTYGLEELQERLTFLQKQEIEIREEMYSSMRNAARYRRQYYYPGVYQTGTPDPSANTFPEGNLGVDNTSTLGMTANPYAAQPNSGISSNAALSRFYTYKGRVERQQTQLAQIRAEISGVQRRIAQTTKTIKDLQKKASNEAVK